MAGQIPHSECTWDAPSQFFSDAFEGLLASGDEEVVKHVLQQMVYDDTGLENYEVQDSLEQYPEDGNDQFLRQMIEVPHDQKEHPPGFETSTENTTTRYTDEACGLDFLNDSHLSNQANGSSFTSNGNLDRPSLREESYPPLQAIEETSESSRHQKQHIVQYARYHEICFKYTARNPLALDQIDDNNLNVDVAVASTSVENWDAAESVNLPERLHIDKNALGLLATLRNTDSTVPNTQRSRYEHLRELRPESPILLGCHEHDLRQFAEHIKRELTPPRAVEVAPVAEETEIGSKVDVPKEKLDATIGVPFLRTLSPFNKGVMKVETDCDEFQSDCLRLWRVCIVNS
jgi:hypothetical protein